MEALTLAYLNEDDRAYGLAGMAISMAALDAFDRLASISLDAEGPMVTFSHEYYFSGSPSISPKTTWSRMVDNYCLTSAMALSNVMARSLVRLRREIPDEVISSLREVIAAEGREECDLEDDEIDALLTRTSKQMGRIFRNPRLHSAIEDFVRTISRRRTLSGTEVFDELHALQLI